ncbi:DNA translocase FtsK [Cohnella faecalis]|uniref:DNA translocase FtsK n=1 Tax=Cohnella faecalis TaxID=2315694 RepID=A0A398CL08_9BACL|nr:DNA translocase FtsK [Cohnella faecalis]
MAKRKKKKASFASSLKFEIYGILLITISVFAFAGEAAVGRSISKLFGYLLGNHYYMLALAGAWIGLYAMIKRGWPKGWTSRRSGFLLVALAFSLWSAMALLDSTLGTLEALTPSSIVSQTMAQLKEQLWSAEPATDVPIMKKSLGGGLVGALQYSIFYWMFGYYGAKFVLVVEFAIAILLVTGRSYVEMGQAVRMFLRRIFPLIYAKLSSGRRLLSAKAVPVRTKAKPKLAVQGAQAPIPDDDGLDEPPMQTSSRKTPLFFQLFHGKPEREAELPPSDDWEDEDTPVSFPSKANGRKKAEEQSSVLETPFNDVEIKEGTPSDELHSGPRFTDFAENTATAPWLSGENDDLKPIYADMTRPPIEPLTMAETVGEQLALDLETGTGPEGMAEPAETDSPAPAAEASSPVASTITPKPVRPAPKPYKLPPMNLLDKPAGNGKSGSANDYIDTARKLEATLESFGVRAKVLDVARGPAVTRYELQPDVGVKVSRIVSLTDDIALALAAKDIRMEAPIPGKSAIGIEVPNNEVSVVTLREVLETQAFQEAQGRLTIAFGRDISGQPIVGNLARMPHLLVAGATGSGKSVCINGIITSLLYKAKPDEVKFLMIDPKMVELNVYNGIPHLLAPVVTDPKRASLALKKIVVEMEKRYEKFSKSGTRNIEGYNALMLSGDNKDGVLPYIVVIVDELADLMMVAAGDVEDAICRLAQMARAAGIHLIIATQRPSVDVITGVIKANIPSRIAFGVSSQVDSRTILDMVGAEKLLGRGDMLFLPMGASKPIRVQGAFLSDGEVESVVGYARGQAEAEYNEELVPEVEESDESDGNEFVDELFDQAVQIILEAKQASVSLLQRRMRVGYTRAARLIDSMEAKGIVGPYEGSKPREVLMTMEQYQQRIPS